MGNGNTSKDGPYDEASTVKAKGGEVAVKGPDGVDITLTTSAAIETAERLFYAAAHARGQQISAEKDAKDRAQRRQPGSAPDL